jgi:outer membrane protein TolC
MELLRCFANYRPEGLRRFTVYLFGVLAVVLLAGCSSQYYHKQADDEVYGIIQSVESQVFGHTNEFSIDTRYSERSFRLILPDEIIEDRTVTNQRVLSLESAMGLAVQSSREYQTEKERLYLTALGLTGNRYEFTPRFFNSAVGMGYQGDANGQSSGFVQPRMSVGQFFKTGGNLSVELANSLLRYYTGKPDGALSSTAINAFSVNLSQPLLRGFGKKNPQVEALTQAQRDVVYAVRDFTQYQKQFAVDIVNEYFSLLNRKTQVRNFYTNYLRRAELTGYFEARAVDRANANQVEDARSAELSARISYVTAVAGYLNQMDTFKIRLGIPVSETVYLEDSELTAVEAAGPVLTDVSREAAFALAVGKHMDILNAIDRFEDSKRKIEVRMDQLRPGLNFNASGSADSTPNYTEFDARDIRYSVGLELDLPFDRLRERNDYRATLVSFESQLRSLQLSLDRFKQNIDGGLRSLEEARLNIVSQQAQLAVESRRVDMNAILLEAGRVQIRDVREAQDALISAQNSLTSRVVDYLRVRLQLMLDIGVLETDIDKFWLKDPLAGTLTDAQRGPSPLQMPRDTLIPPNQFLEPNE